MMIALAACDVPLPAPPGEGYLSADGTQLVNADGQPVLLTGVNWFGLETSNCAPHGLWQINMQDTMDQMAELGFTTLRLPYATACIEDGATATGINEQANPDLGERAGNAILEVNPDWLIIVEGVEETDDGTTWWGGTPVDAGDAPVELSNPEKLVYSPHEYAMSVFRQPWRR